MTTNLTWNLKDIEKIDPVASSMAKELCKLGLIKNIVKHPEKDNVLQIRYARGICDIGIKSKTFIDSLKYYVEDDSTGIARLNVCNESTIIKVCKEKTCGYKQCPIKIAGYYSYLEEKSRLKSGESEVNSILDSYELIKIKKAELLKRVNEVTRDEGVKEFLNEMIRLFSHILCSKEAGIELPKPLFNHVFIVNEGVEKDRVHKLVRDILYQFGHFKETLYREIDFENGHTELTDRRLNVIRNLSYLSLSEPKETSMKSSDKEKLNDKKNDFINDIINNYKKCSIIIEGTKEEVEEFLDNNTKLRAIFTSTVTIPDMTNDEIYSHFCKLCKQYSYEIGDTFKDSFISHLISMRNKSPYKNLDYADYLFFEIAMNAMEEYQDGVPVIKSHHLPPTNNHRIDIEDEFKNIVGMEDIKSQLKELQQYLAYNMEISKYTDKAPRLRLHSILMGPAGTGKTSVARIIGKMLYSLGYVKEDKLIESERKDFIAGYTGQTAIKTNNLIKRARGGVLFIDEAYSLGESDSFSMEAVSTLIKGMEDYSDDLVVIFAGYEKEMHSFLNVNSGIASRIGYNFTFNDYNKEELEEILKLKLSTLGYNIDEEALHECRNIIEKACVIKDFGNGRFIDNLIQNIIMKHSSRLDIVHNGTPAKEDLFNLTLEDVEINEDTLLINKGRGKGSIGFI